MSATKLSLLERTVKAAACTVSRCPPRRSYENTYLTCDLAAETFARREGIETEEADGTTTMNANNVAKIAQFKSEFLDTMVQRIDHRVHHLRCPTCSSSSSTVYIVASEYNREGDVFRCPHCNHWCSLHDDETTTTPPQTSSKKRPHTLIREVELVANTVFKEYSRLYFANKQARSDLVVTSSYAWLSTDEAGDEENDDAAGGDDELPKCIGMVTFILHRHSGETEEGDANGDDENESGGGGNGCMWVSTHVARVQLRAMSGLKYSLQSTMMVDVNATAAAAASTVGAAQELSRQRWQGFVGSATTEFTGHALSSTTTSSSSSLNRQAAMSIVLDLGDHIQRTENSMRDSIEAIHFGKVGSMMAYSLRHGDREAGSGEREKHQGKHSSTQRDTTMEVEIDQRKASGADDNTAAAGDEEQKKKKSKSKQGSFNSKVWEPCQDEEGNTYYYNSVTGDTSWELPVDEEIVEESHVQASDNVPPEETQEAEAEGDAGQYQEEQPPLSSSTSRNAVLSILTDLSLSQPAEQYYKALKKYLKQFYEMKLDEDTFLQLEDAAFTLGEGEDGMEGEQRQVLEVLIPVYGDRRKVLKWMAKRRAEMEEEEASS